MHQLFSQKPKVNKDRCNHVWTQTGMTKPVPTYCEECHDLCFIFTNMRKCSFCDSYLHHDCWKKRIEGGNILPKDQKERTSTSMVTSPSEEITSSSSSGSMPAQASSSLSSAPSTSPTLRHFHAKDGQVIQQQEHVHSLVLAKSATIGSFCDVCSKHIFSFGGGSHEYFYCVDCEWRAHRHCHEQVFIQSHQLQEIALANKKQVARSVDVAKDGSGDKAVVVSDSAFNKPTTETTASTSNNNTDDFAQPQWDEINPADSVPQQLNPLPIMTESEYLKLVEERRKKLDDGKNVVITGTLDIVRALDEKYKKWGDYVINPVSLYRVQRKQAAVYLELVNELAEENRKAVDKNNKILVPRDQLDHLHDVLRYATAMYGRAYEEGYFSSVIRNLILQTVKKDLVYAKPEQNNEAVANILGISRSNILMSYWGEEISEPTFAVIDDRDEKRVMLAFRGSITESDFATDALGTLTDFDGIPPEKSGSGVKAHAGILNSVQKLFDPKHKLFIVDKLIEIMKSRPLGTKLNCVGHSLGAGLVELFCARALASDCLAYEHPEATGHTRRTKQFLFGYAYAPPPVLTKPFVDQFDNNIISIVAAKDCVPRLQLPAVDRLGAHFLATKRIKPDTGSEEDLSLADCLAEDEEIAKALETQEECHLAGRIVFTTHPTNRATKAYYIKRESPLLHSVFVSSHMIANHVMDNYAEALQVANMVDEDKIRHELEVEFNISPKKEKNEGEKQEKTVELKKK